MADVQAFLSQLPLVGAYAEQWPVAFRIVGAVLVLTTLFLLYAYPFKYFSLPFRNLPGPKPSSLIWGSLRDVINAAPSMAHLKWTKTYGSTYRYWGLLGDHRVTSVDPTFLTYVLGNDELFHKPRPAQAMLRGILGNGLVATEGDLHTRQRRVVSPAFSTSAIRDMIPLFYDKAEELRDKLLEFVEGGGSEMPSPTPPAPEDEAKGGRKIDVTKYLGQMTVDIIGQAGFGYDLASLTDKPNELAEAFRIMMAEGQNLTPFRMLQVLIPVFMYIRSPSDRRLDKSNAVARRICTELINEKKRELQSLGNVDKETLPGKDLLSLLLRSNMAQDLNPDHKMTDEDVFSQVRTFMLAGNETSSTALTWILYRLVQKPELQRRLREELFTLEDRPTLDRLHSLPFLEAVVRESLRLDSPVPSTIRVAQADTVIPLGKPIVGRDGKTMTEVPVKKGTSVYVPIHVVNWAEDVWGDDALEYNPTRYERENVPASSNPGVYGNLLTFNYGPHNCIGYRFSIAEIKTTLFILLRAMTFEMLPSNPTFDVRTSIVIRPRVLGEEKHGPQLPLLVRALEQ